MSHYGVMSKAKFAPFSGVGTDFAPGQFSHRNRFTTTLDSSTSPTRPPIQFHRFTPCFVPSWRPRAPLDMFTMSDRMTKSEIVSCHYSITAPNRPSFIVRLQPPYPMMLRRRHQISIDAQLSNDHHRIYCPRLAKGSKLQNQKTPENARKQFVWLPLETTWTD